METLKKHLTQLLMTLNGFSFQVMGVKIGLLGLIRNMRGLSKLYI